MRRTAAGTVAIAAFVCLSSGTPAQAQNREHQQMAADLRMLQEQTQQLALAVAQAIAQLTEATKAINDRLDASDAANRKALADQKVIIDAVNTEMRTLRERAQDTNSRIGTLSEEIEALRSALTASASQTQTIPTGATPDPGAVSSNGGTTPSAAVASGVGPTRLFETAFSDFSTGNYVLAINGFQQFLASFPRSEKADDAQLSIGESYLKLNRNSEAISAFSAVIQNYPTGDKLPEAYFRLGEAQRASGQTEAARSAWQTVLNRYADTPMATLAKQRLEGLPAQRQP